MSNEQKTLAIILGAVALVGLVGMAVEARNASERESSVRVCLHMNRPAKECEALR